jgi:hypothetical protein
MKGKNFEISFRRKILKEKFFMTERRLSEEEEIYINKFSQLNEKRDFIQNLVVTEFAKHKKYIANLFTSSGKSRIVYYAIKRMQKKFGNSLPYVVIVPTTLLKEDFEKLLKEFENVHVFVVNTYIKNKPFNEIRALFVDESHVVLGENSQFFNKTIELIPCEYILLLSATLDKNQEAFASNLGFKNKFVIDSATGLKLRLIPPYKTYNLLISLSKKEQLSYDKIENEYKDYMKMFSQVREYGTGYFISNCLQDNQYSREAARVLNKEVGVIIYCAKRWWKQVNARKNLLYKAASKKEILEQLLQLTKDKQSITYVYTKQEALDIAAKDKQCRKSYVGTTSSSVIQEFDKKEISQLISCNKLVVGQVTDNVEFIFRLVFNTKERIYEQSKGRSLRFDKQNPNKQSVIINLIAKDTQDIEWVVKQTKNERFLQYVESIEEIEELYEY